MQTEATLNLGYLRARAENADYRYQEYLDDGGIYYGVQSTYLKMLSHNAWDAYHAAADAFLAEAKKDKDAPCG